MEFIEQLALIFIAATFFGVLSRIVKLPLIVAYIVAGIFIGPNLLGLISDSQQIKELSSIGIVFLLFLVGIELNFKKLKDVGKVALITTLGQFLLSLAAGIYIASLIGFPPTASVFIGIALAFNSTVIIVKSLSEKRELNSLHGRISIGVLLVQDAIAVGALVLLNAFSGNGTDPAYRIIEIFLEGGLLFVGLVLSGTYLFPPIFKHLAKSPELLMVSTIGWALFAVMIAKMLGLSIEFGAFIAGVSIASLPYTSEITAKIHTLRDFFITIFFVSLGMSISFIDPSYLIPILLLTSLVIVGTPLIVTLLLILQGFKSTTSLKVGLQLSQISEFSIKILALAWSLNVIDQGAFTIMILVTTLTMIISSVIMNHIKPLSLSFSRLLAFLESKKQPTIVEEAANKPKDHVVVLGAHYIGQSVLNQLNKIDHFKDQIVVIDVNPNVIKQLESENYRLIYGDVSDLDILDEAKIGSAKLVISTIPDFDANQTILHMVKKNRQIRTVVYLTAKDANEALLLYESGADYVILPQYLSGQFVGSLIEDYEKHISQTCHKQKHIHDLNKYLQNDPAI